LTVDRQLLRSRTASEERFGPPKSKQSYRTVPLADAVVQALARHVELHGVGDHGVVLHGPSGRPLLPSRFARVWGRTRAQAGLPGARFHTSRHTFASMLLSGGVSVPAAAEYLGHTPKMLLTTYAHLLPADHDRARQVIEAALGESSRVTDVSPGSAGSLVPRR
jgi:integrase